MREKQKQLKELESLKEVSKIDREDGSEEAYDRKFKDSDGNLIAQNSYENSDIQNSHPKNNELDLYFL